ncbi:protein kinase [Streptomyces sp. NBC_00124]|uniref:serine/threonine-protein kinase n=1 Tax=Streptomyces sp. NBC_00124 TaxID=2975662 RepID=UPI00225217B4|nr:serine/threonine-protein kinase [Streptomyces sp. NBC_00124]MCX5364061.1 protein kinase [Streptomyces sp. NBC_00124]
MPHDLPTENANQPSRVIAGRYRLNRPIGAGGMGEVWHAYDERLDRRVAVKMMLTDVRGVDGVPGFGAAEALRNRRDRFLREVRTTAALEHLGIPAVYDTGIDEDSGRLYVVMQLLRGRELAGFIKDTDYTTTPLAVSWAAAAGAQIASALDVVHQHDVVHRDIKPANLMLIPDGVVKVLDFGVAALLGSGAQPRLTQEGMTVGTPPYMSPEQSLANAVGPASDIYALACVLYELLTGMPPFTADSHSYAWHHVRTPPPPIRTLRPDVPEELEDLLLGMLDKEPEHRLDAAQVYDALLPLVYGQDASVTARPEFDPRQPFRRPFGGPPKRAKRVSYTPTEVVPVPHDAAMAASPAPLTDQEADEVADVAAQLVQDGQFVQAADLLVGGILRAQDDVLRDDLFFSLAQVKFIAGAYGEASEYFEAAEAGYAERHGAEDEQAQLCRYYVAQCRMALGEATAAIEAFRAYLAHEPDTTDEAAVARYLDSLFALARLHAAKERFAEAMAVGEQLRGATRRLRGPAAPDLVDIDGFLARLSRFTR